MVSLLKERDINMYKDMNLLLFQKEFSTEEDCRNWLFKSRWPKGFACPKCDHGKSAFLSRNKYECLRCHYQVSATAGTILHKTKTPLLKWFWLIFRMATSKTGVSIAEMRRELDIKDYKTIWVMAHKIRKAMADRDARYKLAGLVEMDESFFGSSSSGKRGRGANKKETVIVAVSTWKDKDGIEKPGFAHAFVVKSASADSIGNILKRIGVPDEEIIPLIDSIRSDGWRSYQSVSKDLGLVHHRVILRDPKDSMNLLPWTHKLIANAKAVIKGPHRGVSSKHLQHYLSEVCYRFNRRYWYRQSFHRLLTACVTTQTATRDELLRNIPAQSQ